MPGGEAGAVGKHEVPSGEGGHPLDHGPVGVARVGTGHDVPGAGSPRPHHHDPVARFQHGPHAVARHLDPPEPPGGRSSQNGEERGRQQPPLPPCAGHGARWVDLRFPVTPGLGVSP